MARPEIGMVPKAAWWCTRQVIQVAGWAVAQEAARAALGREATGTAGGGVGDELQAARVAANETIRTPTIPRFPLGTGDFLASGPAAPGRGTAQCSTGVPSSSR